MSRSHGNKRHFQVLLDPNRAALLKELADECKMAPSALMRLMVYKKLSDYKSNAYAEAASADDRQWKQSVQNRVDGRTRAAAARKIKPIADKPTFDLDALIGKIFT
jgi:hypothetical protein